MSTHAFVGIFIAVNLLEGQAWLLSPSIVSLGPVSCGDPVSQPLVLVAVSARDDWGPMLCCIPRTLIIPL